MRDLQDGMVRSEARQDAMEKRTESLESKITHGFESVLSDIKGLRSIRAWVIGGIAAGRSAVGSAIFHALQTALH